MNTQTGQLSRDLPQEADGETSDGDLAGLTSQSSSRSGTSAGLGLSAPASESSESSQENINSGVSRRLETPEPWVKKLADDGVSYYYWNKLNGQTEWTRPQKHEIAAIGTHDQSISHLNNSNSDHNFDRDTLLPSMRLPSDSSMPDSQQQNHNLGGRLSSYSDDSDIHPSERERFTRYAQPSNNDIVRDRGHRPLPRHTFSESISAELTSAEKLAQSLQESLTPLPPELITDLSDAVRRAIIAVVESIQSAGLPRRPDEDLAMDSLVHAVVLAVRNLLYVSAAPSHIPSNVLPREARDRRINTASHTLLKPAQRKVTATLSKLVLSARAMQYDSRSSEITTSNRIEGDAEELERAVIAFVLAADRYHNQEDIDGGKIGIKRLNGVFSTANVGMGLVGAGSAGSWKGFGWVALENDDEAPRRILGTEVASELASFLLKVEERLSVLAQSLKNLEGGSGEILVLMATFFLTSSSS